MSTAEPSQLERVALNAWHRYQSEGNTAIDDVYEDIMPFCLRVCSRTCGRYINSSDEEASIARVALIEAFEKYNPERGSILLYLGFVIKNRIIDYRRSEDRHSLIPLSALQRDEKDHYEVIDDTTVEEIIEDLSRQQDIVRFKQVLNEYGITFEDLAKASPRQQKTLKASRQIARAIAESREITQYLQDKKMLPVRLLEKRMPINRKITDRYRKFIIASALIIIADIACLKPYVLTGGEEGD